MALPQRLPAAGIVAGTDLPPRRLLAARLVPLEAAVLERAARRQVDEARHHSRDGLEGACPSGHPRQRIEEPDGVWVGGPAEQHLYLGTLYDFAGVHDRHVP